MQTIIDDLKLNKCDLKIHKDVKENIESAIRDMASNYQLQIDRMLNTENYIEKYLPLFFQR